MHTFMSTDGTVDIQYNTDLSGDVIINMENFEEPVEVPGDALLEFVLNYLMHRKISALESANMENLLFAFTGSHKR